MAIRTVSIYQLKIALKHVRPPVWRRVQVPSNIALQDLHLVIQAAMGWENCHLHCFNFGGRQFSAAFAPGELLEMEMENEQGKLLSTFIKAPKDCFTYEYDFGDDWEHQVTLEKLLPLDPELPVSYYPLCIAGKRACPPEDCGGPFGYADLLRALADPTHPDHNEMMEWASDIDPEAFDPAARSAHIKSIGC